VPGQLSLFEALVAPRADEAAERRLLQLGPRIVEYRFRRSRRRTIGIMIDAEGLRVSAPRTAPWREVERFLSGNAAWIARKLDSWGAVQRGPLLHGMSGETLPLFGEPVVLDIRSGRRAVVAETAGQLILTIPDPDRYDLVIDCLLAWMKAIVIERLQPRVAHYAGLLGLSVPRLAASGARRHWGTCTSSGLIRLNWRLAHLAPALCDYVVAHEVSHLREMNHSPGFWATVEGLYPEWRSAREHLEQAGARLPRIERPKAAAAGRRTKA